MKLNAIQKTAILTAVKKSLESELKQYRAEADEEILELYEGFGSDRVKIKLGDVEIGSMTLCFATDEYIVTDEAALNEFLLLNGLATEKTSIDPTYMVEVIARIKDDMPQAIVTEVVPTKDFSKLIKRVDDSFVIEGTNEVVPGISPAPQKIKGTRITGCKPEDVLPVINSLPGTLDTLLLGGGQNEQ